MGKFNRDNRSGDFKKRDFNQGNRSGFARPSMHEAICSQCGQRCEVPFRPTGEKPVYCNDCFRNKRPGGPKPAGMAASASVVSAGISKDQFNQLQVKLDKIIALLSPASVSSAVLPEVKMAKAAVKEEKKEVKAKKAPATKKAAKKSTAKKKK